MDVHGGFLRHGLLCSTGPSDGFLNVVFFHSCVFLVSSFKRRQMKDAYLLMVEKTRAVKSWHFEVFCALRVWASYEICIRC